MLSDGGRGSCWIVTLTEHDTYQLVMTNYYANQTVNVDVSGELRTYIEEKGENGLEPPDNGDGDGDEDEDEDENDDDDETSPLFSPLVFYGLIIIVIILVILLIVLGFKISRIKREKQREMLKSSYRNVKEVKRKKEIAKPSKKEPLKER